MPRMSIRAYARHRLEHGLQGGTHGAVRKAIARGRVRIGTDGKIDSEDADRSWSATTDPMKAQAGGTADAADDAGGGGSGGISLLARAAAVEKKFKAKIAQLDFEERAGVLANRDEMTAEWEEHVTIARQKLLAIPSKIRSRIPEMRREHIVEIDALIRETLEHLSTDPDGDPE